ncbi:MAG: PEGA domain-containing protein [Candidatus Omnitrophica bacterium]|nr:PEGA domain-containing protein [Candidatus Omnitrophota bacterium]
MGLKQLRNFIFWTLVLLYFVLAPVICFQALGFVFDPRTISFVKTGIISIDSEPKEASVYLNGALYAEKTPTAISRLRAGRYEVRVEAPNYQTWVQPLEVRAEEVTRAEHILLPPVAIKPSALFSIPVQTIVPSHDERFLFLISQDAKATAVYAFDMKKDRLMFLADHPRSPDNPIASVSLNISPDDRRLLVLFHGKTSDEHIVATISDRAIPISLSKLIKMPIANVRFHPRSSKEMLYLQNGVLNQLDLEEGILKEGILKGLKSFEVIEDKIYYFTDDAHLFSANLDGKEAIDLLPDRGLRRLLFGQNPRNTYRMFLTPKGNAFWLSEKGTLLTNRLPYFADEDVSGATLSTISEKLFYWKAGELWLLDLSDLEEKRQNFFERGPSKTLLWKSNQPIVSVRVMREDNHAIVVTEKKIVLVETEPRLSGNQFIIGNHSLGRKITFYFNDDLGELYWTDLQDEIPTLYHAKLFRPSLFPFSFSFRKSYQSPEEVFL